MYIQIFEDNGTRLNEIITKHLDDDIWEFHPGNNCVLYFISKPYTSKSGKQEENYQAALKLADEIKDKTVEVKMKAGEGGRTFGSVSTKEISQATHDQLGLELDKKKMQLKEAIKSFGVYEVPVKVHPKVTATLRVKVTEE